jgi:hypothetical protein
LGPGIAKEKNLQAAVEYKTLVSKNFNTNQDKEISEQWTLYSPPAVQAQAL